MFSGSLRAFDEAVRAGSIRKASEKLGVAPSSVSRHIAILEQQIGTPLFHRRAGGIELTPAGKLVADFARSVLLEYDTLRTDLDDFRGMQRRLLRVALVESVAHSGPINAIAAFLDRHQTGSFNVRLMPAPQVMEAVREGNCDVGVTFCAEADPAIVTMARVQEPIVLVVHAGHKLAAAARVDLRDIADLPVALPDSDFGVRQILDRECAVNGFRLAPALSSNVFETLRDFVRLGAGVAILPLRAVSRREGIEELRIIPLVGSMFSEATVDVIVLRKRRLPRITKVFVEMLIQEITRTEGPTSVSHDKPAKHGG